MQRRALGLAAVVVLAASLLAGLPPRSAQAAGHARPEAGGVLIKHSYAARQYLWTQVNRKLPDRSYWQDGRDDARAGWSTRPRGIFRSLFQVDLTPIAGTRVHDAYFAITLDRSNFCREVPVELWHTRAIDPAVPLTWNNSRDHWLEGRPLATGTGQACDDLDTGMEFGGASLHRLVQDAADRHSPTLTLGLRVPEEGDPRQGMLFQPETAVLVVEYNSPPDAPTRLSTVPPTPCGTAEAPISLNDGRGSRFSAVATDPDRDNLNTLLEIVHADGTIVHASESATTTSGAAFSWPELPAGVLRHGETYHYRARSSDHLDTGPYTDPCYFTVDAVEPGTPRIASTDYPPDGEPVIPARTTGTLTLRPAEGDTDIAEYRFGLQQFRMTRRIKAAPDGTAVLPITVHSWFGESLYVRAVDHAGNPGPTAPAWELNVLDNPAPPAHEPGDATGDGRADVVAVLDHGFERTMIWNLVAREGGFHAGVVGFDSGFGGGVEPERNRFVRADFDGDGRTDLIALRENLDGTGRLTLVRSDGNGYAGTSTWDSGDQAWPLATTRMAAGDFDGDGTSDLAVRLATAGGGWQVLVFRDGRLAQPEPWHIASGGGADAHILAGDFDGDGRADLAELRDEGDCRASLVLHRSTGTAFGDGQLRWDSGTGGYCTDRATLVAGDVHGDGKDDLIARYDHAGAGTTLQVFDSADGPVEWWRDPGFDPGLAVLGAGDFDLDGRADLAMVTTDTTTGRTQLWTSRSTGSGFTAPVLGWQETTGGVPYGP
ncbi:FG-GAP repeat domain-containing protein [Amycolatopsis aidingensis]|uniref:FG-GAP repeat domain-containing protein n=1 Tax=Amycolatopsis aidingensis TaxID=2842453 RepID=UPI001C0AD981|nr:VCBS repeat-containing protein [Amycolatopsis aidingensis]